jgi:hypothetical protein
MKRRNGKDSANHIQVVLQAATETDDLGQHQGSLLFQEGFHLAKF